jgi:hypothetical protein
MRPRVDAASSGRRLKADDADDSAVAQTNDQRTLATAAGSSFKHASPRNVSRRSVRLARCVYSGLHV